MVIDSARHAVLNDVAQGAQWVGTDEFPSCAAWADEHETWLQFVKGEGALDRYLPRLKGPKERRDEAFAEIAVAYFFAAGCGLSIREWEPRGAGAKVGEFLIGFDGREPIFIEVKSPGWEEEIAKVEGQASSRLQQPKYISDEARATAPWASVRHAVKKAYPKMPDSMPTLLVINDDLVVPLLDWGNHVTEMGLYTRKSPCQDSGYLAEDGPFADNRCERLGGVGVFNVRLLAEGVEYRFALFENPHALPAVVLPPNVADGYPKYTGASPSPALVGGKPWFARVLEDEEWRGDPSGKAQEKALKVIAEFEQRRSGGRNTDASP
jgi:hypothetical protein